MPAPKIYQDITHAKWMAVKKSALAWGINILDTHGEATTAGVRFSWEWLKTKKTLRILIIDGGPWGDDASQLFVDGLLVAAINAVLQ
jgi:hypothetical protein